MPKSDASFDPAEYALVAERIAQFYERHPMGRIVTHLVSRTERQTPAGIEREITFRARVYRTSEERRPAATGWASERDTDGDINAVACLENTETSAIGRALANLGFAAARRRPSREEMAKVRRSAAPPAPEVRESAPARYTPLQRRADLVSDALSQLAMAARDGLEPGRAATLRRALTADETSEWRLVRIERRLRHWVARRVDARLSKPGVSHVQRARHRE